MPSLLGTDVAANYLVVKQSPGAALAGLNAEGDAPLLTFNTPNLRAFKVTVTGVNLSTNSEVANSNWSKAVRSLQVTSELFAVFAPSNADPSVFVFMAPDFNTNAGAATPTGDAQAAIAAEGGTFTVVRQALADALGLTLANIAVARTALTGVTWS